MTPDTVRKRSIAITGHKTSVSLENAYWKEIRRLAHAQRLTVSQFVEGIDRNRKGRSLSSSLRIAVLDALNAELALVLDFIAADKALAMRYAASTGKSTMTGEVERIVGPGFAARADAR